MFSRNIATMNKPGERTTSPAGFAVGSVGLHGYCGMHLEQRPTGTPLQAR